MGRFGVLVIGPAGSGKSTLCERLQEHMRAARRHSLVANLDPAAEHFAYEPDADIREIVTVEEIMEKLEYGPNGGLVHALENIDYDWFGERLGADCVDDFWIFDCPGQIELYLHLDVMKNIIAHLRDRLGFGLCALYCVEAPFVIDRERFLSASLCATATMMQLELPHLNVLTKRDLLRADIDIDFIERHLITDLDDCDDADREGEGDANANATEPMGKQKRLHRAIASLIESTDLVSFDQLDVTDDDSVGYLLQKIDLCLNYADDAEPFDPCEETGSN